MKRTISPATLALAVCLNAAAALAQAPSITHSAPAAVAPGQTVDVTFFGANLAGATSLWTTLPGKVELAPGIDKNGTDAAKVVYRWTVPTDAQPAIGGLRIATDKGVSNLRLFMIDDLPTLPENGKNKKPATAQELNLPLAIDGVSEAESYDYYKFTAAKGARVSIEVVARRLGSPLDPVVRLLDAAGRELAYSDDEPGLGADCRCGFTAPADGSYTIEVRDIQYAGSANHRYRLRVGDFPLVTVPYPMGVQKGVSAKVSFAGPSVEGATAVDLNVPVESSASQTALGAKFATGGGSALTRVIVDTLPETVEAEPNNKLEESTPAVVPGNLNGRFAEGKDRDYFRFEAKKGERFQFSGLTRSLGSPTDLFLRLYKADGGSVAEAEDTGTEEGSFNYAIPADGVYHLMVEDLLRRGGPQHAYRVRVDTYKPGFSLALDADKFDPPKAGVFVTKVTCVRRDYTGPITLEVQGGGEGFVLSGQTIAEGKNDTTLSVTIPDRLAPGHLTTLAVVGKAKIGDAEVSVKATTTAALVKQYPGLTSLPEELLSSVGMGVGPAFADFFKLSVDPGVVLLPQLVGAGSFKVKVEKLNKFDDVVALAIEGLPEGVTAEVKPIEKGKPEAVVSLKGPETLAEGEHKFKLTGKATFQNQPKQVTLGEVVLRVTRPLVVAAAPAGTIAPGGKQKLKVTVTRFGDHKAPIALSFKNLPAGVTAPEGAAVPEGKNDVELELAAAADAAAVKAENVVVVGTTKVKDQEVTAETTAIVLEVKP